MTPKSPNIRKVNLTHSYLCVLSLFLLQPCSGTRCCVWVLRLSGSLYCLCSRRYLERLMNVCMCVCLLSVTDYVAHSILPLYGFDWSEWTHFHAGTSHKPCSLPLNRLPSKNSLSTTHFGRLWQVAETHQCSWYLSFCESLPLCRMPLVNRQFLFFVVSLLCTLLDVTRLL